MQVLPPKGSNFLKSLVFICLILAVVGITRAYASVFQNILQLFAPSALASQKVSKVLDTSDLISPQIDTDNATTETESINQQGLLSVDSGPMRVSTEKTKVNDGTISLYEVKEGDSLSTIAQLFGISVNTIVWANDLEDHTIHPGETLLIFPMNGIEYTVKNGGTIEDIAKKYKADAQEIASYNGLALNTELKKGDTLFIPDAEMETVEEDTSAESSSKTKTSTPKVVTSKFKQIESAGYFILPVNGCIKTQGLHGPYNSAVDIGCPVGTPVHAAADGTVIRADATGYNGGYGKVIILSHPNNVQTIYAHLSEIDVELGDKVTQGEVMGKTGNTGESTGPHIHFETRGTANPF